MQQQRGAGSASHASTRRPLQVTSPASTEGCTRTRSSGRTVAGLLAVVVTRLVCNGEPAILWHVHHVGVVRECKARLAKHARESGLVANRAVDGQGQ